MEVLRVLSSVSQGEGVNLDPEGNALLSAVLPGSELSADAVHLEQFRQQAGKETPSKCNDCGGEYYCFCVLQERHKESLCGIPAQKQKFFSSCPTGTPLH